MVWVWSAKESWAMSAIAPGVAAYETWATPAVAEDARERRTLARGLAIGGGGGAGAREADPGERRPDHQRTHDVPLGVAHDVLGHDHGAVERVEGRVPAEREQDEEQRRAAQQPGEAAIAAHAPACQHQH